MRDLPPLDRAEALQHILANTSQMISLYTSLRWNVTGSQAQTLSHAFAEQAREMARATECLARRIRALGQPAYSSYPEEVLVPVVTCGADIPRCEDMAPVLARGHAALAAACEEVCNLAAEARDYGTFQLLVERQGAHDRHRAALSAMAG